MRKFHRLSNFRCTEGRQLLRYGKRNSLGLSRGLGHRWCIIMMAGDIVKEKEAGNGDCHHEAGEKKDSPHASKVYHVIWRMLTGYLV